MLMPAAPAPLMTTDAVSADFPKYSSALMTPARTMMAVPC